MVSAVEVTSMISTGRVITSLASSGRGGPIMAATRWSDDGRSYNQRPSAGAAAAGRRESPPHPSPDSPADTTARDSRGAFRSPQATTMRAMTVMIAATAQATGLTDPDITNPECERADSGARALLR